MPIRERVDRDVFFGLMRQRMLARHHKFLGVLALLCGMSACTQPELLGEAVGENDADAYVVQSTPLDTKEYRYVELDNGMRVLLISDAEAVQAAASLRVAVGSYQDPEAWEGLAHFLEHMLFLGTEKYPDADEYVNYLKAHGGQRNAVTSYDMTNYHFSVNGDAFEGALDRFAQFFIAPLFTEEYVEREKNAVHSEYFTRIDNDGVRAAEVFESVINPRHPAAKFNAGNLETLADKPDQTAREVLIDFYQTYYSADRMILALTSNASLDALEALAREKFAAVPVLEQVPDTAFPPLFDEGSLPKVVEYKPVQEQRALTLTFPIEPVRKHKRVNPLGFITSLINTEVENSLRERLKARGWILSLNASPGINYGGNDSFSIGVGLTEAGVKHQDEIIAALLDQIALVRKRGVQEWRYDEMKNIAEMAFRFAENGPAGLQGVIAFTHALHNNLPRDVISSGFERFDASVIHSVLDQLRPDNMVVTLAAPSVTPEKTTEFYGAGYRVYRPSAERVARWSQPLYADLALPERNPLIPESFELEPVVSAEKPVLLSDSGLVELWHYPDIKEGIPRATIMLAIDRPDRPSMEQVLVEQFYFTLLTEQLQVLAHNTSRAGMGYAIGANGVSFSGYSDKLPELSELVLAQVLKPRFTQDVFDRLVDSTERNFRNYGKIAPTKGIALALQQLLNADSHSIEAQLAAVRKVTLEQVLAAPEWLYGEAKMQMLAAGNVTESQARDFADRIVATLGITGTDREIPQGMRVVRVNESEQPHDVLVAELEHQDTAVLRYYQGRDSSPKERIVLGFLGQMLNQHYFNELRTEQQLGYIVQAGASQMDRTPGLAFVVQSPTADAAKIEAATDRFLPSFEAILANMTAAEFEPLQQATLAQLNQPPQNLGQRVGAFWQELRLGYPQFNSREAAIEAVGAVTLQDVRDAYEAVVLNTPRAVSVIAPGALGGVKGTIESPEAYRQDREIIVRRRDEEIVARQ